MLFFSVFFRTLGFLSALLIFLIIISILLQFSGEFEKKHFVMTDGISSSNNIIASINLNGPIFNKNNNLTTNDMDSLISHFIANFSKNDSKTIHSNIWKRIIKCVDKLIF